MTGESGAAGWSTTWPGLPVGWASRGVHDDRRTGPPGSDRSRARGERPGHTGPAGQPAAAEPTAASAIAASSGLAAGPACPDDDLLLDGALGRWAGHRQHRRRAVALAVQPRWHRLAVTPARLLVDSDERGAVGIRPGQLPGRYRHGPVDSRPGRAPGGCYPHVHYARGQPGRRPAASRR